MQGAYGPACKYIDSLHCSSVSPRRRSRTGFAGRFARSYSSWERAWFKLLAAHEACRHTPWEDPGTVPQEVGHEEACTVKVTDAWLTKLGYGASLDALEAA